MAVFAIPVEDPHTEKTDESRVIQWHDAPVGEREGHSHHHGPHGVVVMELWETVAIPTLMTSGGIQVFISRNEEIGENPL